MPKIGVILSGCGVMDGAEVHESVVTLLALDRAGAEVVCMAPDIPQTSVVDHHTGQPAEGQRNVRVEAARVARGPVEDVANVSADDLDALVMPGGFGVAKNLSTFAADGPTCTYNEDVARLLKAMHAAGKPIGAMCIAPALVARVLGDQGPTLTIGNDEGVAEAIEQTGATHRDCPVDEIVVDERHRIITTPAYMLAGSIKEAAAGIEKLVDAVLRMAGVVATR